MCDENPLERRYPPPLYKAFANRHGFRPDSCRPLFVSPSLPRKNEAPSGPLSTMHVTPELVADERARVRDRAPVVVPLLNETRDFLGDQFGVDVATATDEAYLQEVDAVFADGDRAVNVAAYTALLRDLDVADDYPGFVVDEVLGRKLAATIAGGDPLGTLAEATFHVADLLTDDSDATAGADDLDAALAAGFQTRLPGWEWTERESPFSVDPE
jgi:hypothetical protein